MTLAKTLARHRKNPTRPYSVGEEVYLRTLVAKGGNNQPSVRAKQGRRVTTGRRTSAEERRARRQRLAVLGRNKRA